MIPKGKTKATEPELILSEKNLQFCIKGSRVEFADDRILYAHSLSIQFENGSGAGESYISIAYRICLEIRVEANSGLRCNSRCVVRD